MFVFGLYGLILSVGCVCVRLSEIRLVFFCLLLCFLLTHLGVLALLPNKVNSGELYPAIGVNLSCGNDSRTINGPPVCCCSIPITPAHTSTHKINHVHHPLSWLPNKHQTTGGRGLQGLLGMLVIGDNLSASCDCHVQMLRGLTTF